MNIKSITGSASVKEIQKKEKKTAESSPDRDPQNENEGEGFSHKRKMTEEEVQQAVESIKQLQGVSNNNLQVRSENLNGTFVVFVEDINGKVIRRIPESDLWFLTREKDKEKGHLFDRAM
jgi:uncharacterized FlaG/YvyC family protein